MTRDLEGKRFVITGANTGIGRATAVALARRGGQVTMLNRSEDKTRPVLDELRAAGTEGRFFALDLADLASVRACADRLAAETDHIDVLINNAGLARQPGITKQGFELTFGVNHLGHFLLTERLRPLLRSQGGPARIVNVASRAQYDAGAFDWEALRRPSATFTGLREYAWSKLANVLHAAELARRLPRGEVHAYSLHPGGVASDVWRGVPWPIRQLILLALITNEEGAQTSLYCATSPDCREETGLYYSPGKRGPRARASSALAQDPALARELWERSEAWVADFNRS